MCNETGPTRRNLLVGVGIGIAMTCAGCVGDNDQPDPISIAEGNQCDNCDMSIRTHPGPVGQAFYPDERPTDVPDDRPDGVTRFCSSWCLYAFTLDMSDLESLDPAISYATDYSTVDYGIDESGPTPAITAHFDADSFAPVDELTFVVDSEVTGAMGRSLIGFSDAGEADEFVEDYGGETYTDSDISRQLIQAL